MASWRCVICGCDFDEAHAKRRRRREPPIATVKVQTCSRECEEKRKAARAEAQRQRRKRGARRKRPAHQERRALDARGEVARSENGTGASSSPRDTGEGGTGDFASLASWPGAAGRAETTGFPASQWHR